MAGQDEEALVSFLRCCEEVVDVMLLAPAFGAGSRSTRCSSQASSLGKQCSYHSLLTFVARSPAVAVTSTEVMLGSPEGLSFAGLSVVFDCLSGVQVE